MKQHSPGFLPNFCAIPMVFAVVVTAELLAMVLTVVSASWPERFWEGLGLHSLYVQWVALSSTGLLCLLGPWLRRLGHAWGGLLAWLLILMVTALVSILAVRYSGAHAEAGAGLWFMLKSLIVSAIVGALVLRYLYEQFRERQRELAVANSRLDALQARIRPHFLFNSMNTIAGLTRTDPALAEEVVQDLSDLFRASLSDPARAVTLQDEFDLARAYLQIEGQRLGKRLRVDWDIEAVPMDARVPPLLLQPLLENAVYHGVEPSADGGHILVTGRFRRNLVNLSVRNSQPAAGRSEREGNRMAMQNLRDRLALAFGDDSGLAVSAVDGDYQVRLHFPYRGGAA